MALSVLFSGPYCNLDDTSLKTVLFALLYFPVYQIALWLEFAPYTELPSMREYMGQTSWTLKAEGQTQDHGKFTLVRITLVSLTT